MIPAGPREARGVAKGKGMKTTMRDLADPGTFFSYWPTSAGMQRMKDAAEIKVKPATPKKGENRG